MWETPRSTGRRFSGLIRPKWSFLATRLDTMFGQHQTQHITTKTHKTQTVKLGGGSIICGDAPQQQALEGLKR